MTRPKQISEHDAEEVAMFMEHLRDKESMAVGEFVNKWREYMGLSEAEAEAYIARESRAMTEEMPDEFDEWFDANYYTYDPIARRTIRAAFFAGKELGEKAGRSAQKDVLQRNAAILCETRGHEGRRPCEFCLMQCGA